MNADATTTMSTPPPITPPTIVTAITTDTVRLSTFSADSSSDDGSVEDIALADRINIAAKSGKKAPAPSTVIAAAAVVATGTTAAYGKRGPVYTAIEELMVCKSFIAASEDAIVGTSQKGKDFKNKLYKFYGVFFNGTRKT